LSFCAAKIKATVPNF